MFNIGNIKDKLSLKCVVIILLFILLTLPFGCISGGECPPRVISITYALPDGSMGFEIITKGELGYGERAVVSPEECTVLLEEYKRKRIHELENRNDLN